MTEEAYFQKRSWRSVESRGEMSRASVRFIPVDCKGRVTLPEDVRAALGLKQGGPVLLEKTARGTYELKPAALVPHDQLWFYHPKMQGRVAQVEAEFRAGRAVRSETPEEVQTLLDSLKEKPRAGP